MMNPELIKITRRHFFEQAFGKAVGIGIGLLAAFALTRVMAHFLFDVSPTDPVVFAVVALGLLAVASLACSLPAYRASKVDPIVALRQE